MTFAPFDTHEDIRRASTPPAEFYRSAAAYELARERIFAPSWQFIGTDHNARVPGAIHPFTFLEGCIDEPMLLTRDDADTLHCISNVCTHRGKPVAEADGVAKSLRCRYHGRRFGLDGKFQFMPEFEGVEGFPSACDDLRKLPLAKWSPLLFAAINPAVAAETWLGPMRERLAWLPLDDFRFEANLSKDYLVRANWALYCENYLEGFHIPFVHAGLSDVLDYGSYAVELHRWSSLQLGIAKSGEACFDLPKSSPDFGKNVAAYYYWLFPNLMMNFYPWGLSINVVRPLGPERTKVSFLSYVWDATKLESGAGAGLDRVEREDEAIVEDVQRGLGSRVYSRGRYSPTRETGTHHFHRLLSEVLFA